MPPRQAPSHTHRARKGGGSGHPLKLLLAALVGANVLVGLLVRLRSPKESGTGIELQERGVEVHSLPGLEEDDGALLPHVLEVLDSKLRVMKAGMNNSMAWNVVQSVEKRLGSYKEGLNSMVLEAEVEKAITKASAGQEKQPDGDGEENEDGEEEGVDVENGAEVEAPTAESKASADKPQAAQKEKASAKDRARDRLKQEKASKQVVKAEKVDRDLPGAGLKPKMSKYDRFKTAMAERAERAKQTKKTITKAAEIHKALDAGPKGVHQAAASPSGPGANAFIKLQEKHAMSEIRVNPSKWLAEAEKSLKPREKYKCFGMPALARPSKSQQSPPPPVVHDTTEAGRLGGLFNFWGGSSAKTQSLDSASLTWRDEPQIADEAVCEKNVVHVAFAINREFQNGAIALVYSILWNAACPARIIFHICHLEDYRFETLLTFFPYLNYRSYIVDGSTLKGSIRGMEYRGTDLENPLNYVRINLPHILPECVQKFLYLDTDTLMLGRVEEVFSTDLEKQVISSPEFCEYKLQAYFTVDFWANRTLSKRFDKEKKACYFNPGVLLVNAPAWRKSGSTQKLLHWMDVQKNSRHPLYTLGSLPPFLLVFAGEVAHMGMAWNEHDLGCGCGNIPIPHKARLLHWSCGSKPWRRIKSGTPCSIDTFYWQPYDLLGKVQPKFWCDDGDLPDKVARLPTLTESSEDGLVGTEGDESVLFEQLFHKPRRRRCAGAASIPILDEALRLSASYLASS